MKIKINVGDLIVAYWNIKHYVIGVVTEKHKTRALWRVSWTGDMKDKLAHKDDDWIASYEMRHYRKAYIDILENGENSLIPIHVM